MSELPIGAQETLAFLYILIEVLAVLFVVVIVPFVTIAVVKGACDDFMRLVKYIRYDILKRSRENAL